MHPQFASRGGRGRGEPACSSLIPKQISNLLGLLRRGSVLPGTIRSERGEEKKNPLEEFSEEQGQCLLTIFCFGKHFPYAA